jgi:methionyl-tRNA formyltransferase
MKIIFFGTPEFALPCFDALIRSGHEVIAAVTQPDKPAGRKHAVIFSPVKKFAVEHNIPVMQPEKAKDPAFLAEYKKLRPDINLVIAFGQLLPDELIYHPGFHTINIHASLLPKYRGASPINWAVINGDTHTGITYQFIEKKLDAGDIIHVEKIRIKDDDTSETLSKRLSRLAADTVLKVFDMVEKNEFTRAKQDELQATYVGMLKKEDGKIDFSVPAEKIINKVRGLLPWPVAYCFFGGKSLKIYSAETGPCAPAGVPGAINGIIKNKGFIVEAYGSCLLVKEVQFEGGKRMGAYEFSLGHKDLKGKVLR